MEHIDNTKFAEFILGYGKTVCYAGEDFERDQPELNKQLIDLGATITLPDVYATTQDRLNVDGPPVMIVDEKYVKADFISPEWCTIFVIPSEENTNVKPWRERFDTFDHESFMWVDNQWQRQSHRHNHKAKHIVPWSQDGDVLFQKQILGVHPELAIYWDRIFPVYAGACIDNVLWRIPIRETVSMIEKAIGDGKDIIIFTNADEALQPHSIHMAHRIIDMIGHMPMSSWYMLTASLDGQASYHNLCHIMKQEPRMNILSGYRFENVIKDSMYCEHPGRSQDFTEHPHWKGREFKIGKRDKKLLCFNRMPRWQRARMVGFLYEHDLIKDSFVSFSLEPENAEVMGTKESWDLKNNMEVLEEFREEPYMYNIYKNWEDLPLVLNRTVDRDNPVDINDDDLQYFDNSYFSVVNETNFYHCLDGNSHRPISCVHTDGVFISEKLYKPIAHRHPFVVAGINRTLKYLRDCGYKTFSPFINEDYDTIVNDEERLVAIENEVLRLAKLTDDEWVELQQHLKPIIDHNYNHLLKIKKLNTTQFKIEEKLAC